MDHEENKDVSKRPSTEIDTSAEESHQNTAYSKRVKLSPSTESDPLRPVVVEEGEDSEEHKTSKPSFSNPISCSRGRLITTRDTYGNKRWRSKFQSDLAHFIFGWNP